MQGKRVSVFLNNGATHKFIDSQMVEQRGIHIETFDGFSVLELGHWKMQCMRCIPNLTLTMGNYSVSDHFFVVDVPETNVVMGVQWLYSLGQVTTE